MAVNKNYGEYMDKGLQELVKNSSYDKATNHATFDASKLDMPEGVTTDSIKTHVEFFNDLGTLTEQATAQVAREQFANNDKLTTIDGTLNMGAFSINSQHHLKQQVGEEYLYGQSTTVIDYVHSTEAADWLETQRKSSQDLAEKLFG
jgi:hypothetical protein